MKTSHSHRVRKSTLFFLMTVFINVTMVLKTYGQSNALLGQYYKAIQVYAPGLNGANEYLDIAAGSRRQWTNVANASSISFLNVSSELSLNRMNPNKYNSIRVSDLSPYSKKNLKLGIGGYFVNGASQSFDTNRAMATTSTHILVSKDMYLSLGMSFGLFNQNVNLDNLSVLYPDNDLIYQKYKENGARELFFTTNVGIAAYSSRFYLAYTVMDAINSQIEGLSIDEGRNNRPVVHNILGGIRLSINEDLDIIPNTFFRYSTLTPTFMDIGVRASYMNSMLAGLSYRSDGSIIFLMGFEFKKIYDFGYAFEYKQLNSGFNNLNTHEVTLGVKLFNDNSRKPIW